MNLLKKFAIIDKVSHRKEKRQTLLTVKSEIVFWGQEAFSRRENLKAIREGSKKFYEKTLSAQQKEKKKETRFS